MTNNGDKKRGELVHMVIGDPYHEDCELCQMATGDERVVHSYFFPVQVSFGAGLAGDFGDQQEIIVSNTHRAGDLIQILNDKLRARGNPKLLSTRSVRYAINGKVRNRRSRIHEGDQVCLSRKKRGA